MSAEVVVLLVPLIATLIASPSLPVLHAIGPSEKAPWQRFQLTRTDAPALDVYVTGGTERLPVFILVQGSKCYPLWSYKESEGKRKLASSLIFDEVTAANAPHANYVAVERRGIKSFTNRPRERPICTDSFGAVTKDDRVADVAAVVLAVKQLPWAGPIFLVGHSEGVDVVTGVARALGASNIAGVALFSGAGPTQFFDFINEARHDGDLKRQREIFDDVIWLTGEAKPEDKYGGVPTKRWVSFAITSTPLDDLKAVNIPVFVAQGAADPKASVESSDVVVLELLREVKRPIRYLRLEGLDHDFVTKAGEDRHLEVVTNGLAWLMSGARTREVIMDLNAPPPSSSGR